MLNLINVATGTAVPDLAEAYVNFRIGVAAQTAFAEEMHWMPVNKNVNIAPGVVLAPVDVAKLQGYPIGIWVENRDNWATLWEKTVGG